MRRENTEIIPNFERAVPGAAVTDAVADIAADAAADVAAHAELPGHRKEKQ